MTAATVATGRPHTAFWSLTPLLRWLAEEPQPPDVELLCAEHDDGTRGASGSVAIQLPGCLANVSAAAYLEIVAGGARSVVVRVDGCASREQVERSVAQARRLVRAAGASARVDCAAGPTGRHRRPVFGLTALPVSRRRLLMLAAPKPGSTLPSCASERDRTMAALRTLESPPNSTLDGIAADSADLAATDCTGCGVCVKSCPANALELRSQRHESASDFWLLLSPARCVDCGRCTHLCPAAALSRAGSLSWGELLRSRDARLLAAGRARTCARCHGPFTAEGEAAYCPVCAFRMENPFGARLANK